jgi:hypothetical protein
LLAASARCAGFRCFFARSLAFFGALRRKYKCAEAGPEEEKSSPKKKKKGNLTLSITKGTEKKTVRHANWMSERRNDKSGGKTFFSLKTLMDQESHSHE